MNKQLFQKDQLNEHKSFQTSQAKAPSKSNSEIQNRQNEMDAKMVQSIEKKDPLEDTLRVTTRWQEITKPGDYRFTQGKWSKYTLPKLLRAEQKRVEVELWQKCNKFIWQRMENSSRETQDEADRKVEVYNR